MACRAYDEGLAPHPCHECGPRGLARPGLAEVLERGDLVDGYRGAVLAQLAPPLAEPVDQLLAGVAVPGRGGVMDDRAPVLPEGDPAAEGAKVVLAARRENELERVADGIRHRGGVAVPVVTDLADDDALARLLATARDECGPVDILVNNAGYAVWKPLEETTIAEWDRTFAVNVRAAACLCAAVLPGMRARRFGRIINIGSEAGVAIVPGLAAYCVSKHALRALTEVIQDCNHDNGIKAWVVCPGFVDTDMGYVVPGANPRNFLTVEEVVDVVRYLLHTGDNVKLGPEILLRTMRNPMAT